MNNNCYDCRWYHRVELRSQPDIAMTHIRETCCAMPQRNAIEYPHKACSMFSLPGVDRKEDVSYAGARPVLYYPSNDSITPLDKGSTSIKEKIVEPDRSLSAASSANPDEESPPYRIEGATLTTPVEAKRRLGILRASNPVTAMGPNPVTAPGPVDAERLDAFARKVWQSDFLLGRKKGSKFTATWKWLIANKDRVEDGEFSDAKGNTIPWICSISSGRYGEECEIGRNEWGKIGWPIVEECRELAKEGEPVELYGFSDSGERYALHHKCRNSLLIQLAMAASKS